MGRMIDAVNPANIGPEYNGRLAVRVTVLADPAAHMFDVEAGNVGPAHVAQVMAARVASGRWAGGYVNGQTYGPLTLELVSRGLTWSDAAIWPAPGCYLWLADPSGNYKAGRWKVAAVPLAIQSQYLGNIDLSDTAANFPARVAGYIDGPVSTWPAAAWARFAPLPDTPTGPPKPLPVPIPGPRPKGHPLYFFHDGTAWYQVFDNGLVVGIPTPADGSALTGAGIGAVVQGQLSPAYTAALKAASPPHP